jgi:uncharacterized membrane protein
MTKKRVDPKDRKIFAWLSSFLTIIGFILAVVLWKDDKHILDYGKEGFVLGIGFIIASFLSFIPFIGGVFYLFVLVLWILSWTNALTEKKSSTFLVSELAEKIKI